MLLEDLGTGSGTFWGVWEDRLERLLVGLGEV